MPLSTGHLAAFATLFAWTIATFVMVKLSRLVQPAVLNRAMLFFSIFLLGILVCILDNLNALELFTIPNSSNWFWLGMSGVLGKSAGDYCGYSALRILGARRRSMISTLTPAFTWFFGFVILNETMNWLGIAAMLLTTLSLLLLINSNAEKSEILGEKFGLPLAGLLYGMAGAALTGLAFILAKKNFIVNGKNVSEFHGTWIRIIIAFSAIMILDVLRNRYVDFVKQFVVDRQKGSLLFFGILFSVVLGLSFSLIAINKMNAAVAYTIFSLVPVCVILVSVTIYKKKVTLRSWLYSIVAVAGVLVLLWRDSLIRYFANYN